MQTVLEARGVSVAFSTSAPVLDDVDVRLSPGWYGLSCACSQES